MPKSLLFCIAASLMTGCVTNQPSTVWRVDTTQDWQRSCRKSEKLIYDRGMASPTASTSHYQSILHSFDTLQSLQSITFRQSPVWHNWDPITNIGPSNMCDAPVALTLGPGDYWLFGRYVSSRAKAFTPKPASLKGFDMPLVTTPLANVFDAPGGLEKGLGGYHAWQSRDMVNWVHHGPVTEKVSRWVTTAEYVDGKAYIYYDYPNDQDPHLYIDKDLTDGQPGKNMGIAFKDPSHGSDCAFIRDLDGRFHVIYEDWSPINARRHSWDSPLAGHAVSDRGLRDFKILNPAVDERTQPTGKTATYPHPHWKQHPDWKSNIAEYNVHEPEQDAFGDWAALSIGGQYYLFSDYHPAGQKIRVAWFTSPDINAPFTQCGEIGMGHPDPDITFAEGRFYLITQMKTDYVSPGPWVEAVTARVGADTNNDGKADAWTHWQTVSEQYDHIKGFSKQIKRIPASLDLSDLPPCYGVCFEFQIRDATKNKSKPVIESVTISSIVRDRK